MTKKMKISFSPSTVVCFHLKLLCEGPIQMQSIGTGWLPSKKRTSLPVFDKKSGDNQNVISGDLLYIFMY